MELLRVSHVESRSLRLEMVLVLVQDWCTVCAKHTIGTEIVLDALDGTPRCRDSSGSSFSVRLETVLNMTLDRCMICAKHTIGSEIILDTPDGTPR